MLSKPNVKIPYQQKPLHILYSVLFIAFWVYSGFTTPDLVNWLTENTLTLSLIIFIVAFYNIFRFSDIAYTLIFLFLLMHVYGSQYQYAENPFGEWFKQTYNLQRNHYDRLVHFGFGLLLAYPMHEVLAYGFKAPRLVSYIMPVELTVSLSALYEVVEWLVADIVYNGGEQGMDFLGMQGDIWDSQKDIALALAGSVLTLTTAFLFRKNKS
ncbi:DUF2238 domain-containing protein [Pontibacter silvestris]|uniref:DUF2238 domain-containing protein n=1 Tax=Pontibacter silvestris TaxID=2305183 RepID=A0ABW4WWS8_9BACT|nr:DUF2238 domain-containing protein [Pontibacter silvestris]MCC9136850.1 DUF2238 domain-containing protein [Pontibacter silvestris]